MAKALSVDLRDRVLAAVERVVLSPGGGPVRGERVERDPLARTRRRKRGRRRPSRRAGTAARAASRRMRRLILRFVDETLGHHARGAAAQLDRAGSPLRHRHALALLRRGDGSRSKKDRACRRAGSSRHPEAARGLVRRPARSRSRPPRLHRRDLGVDQHGAPAMAGADAASVCGPASRTATGRPRPSWPACAARGMIAPWFSTARSTAPPSRPMSNRCSSPSCRPATSSSWTICRATRAAVSRA